MSSRLPSMYDPYECVGIYLFGLPMSQTFADVLLWERLLDAHPATSLAEIGTGEGGFSRYLATQAAYRGIRFATFDIVQPEAEVPGFVLADVLADPTVVTAQLAPPAILFCDGGNKAAELALFAPLLAPGDLLVVHDWGTEVGDADVPTALLERAHEDWCFELRSRSRAFTRLPAAGEPDPLSECCELPGCNAGRHLTTCPEHPDRKDVK